MPTQQSLVDAYLKLKNQQADLDQDIAALEKIILDFSTQNKLSRLRSATHLLSITQKSKTVFPVKSAPDRLLLEKIVKSSPDRDKFMDLDIKSLATAYDQKKLSKTLLSKLKPLAETKPYTKISLFLRSK